MRCSSSLFYTLILLLAVAGCSRDVPESAAGALVTDQRLVNAETEPHNWLSHGRTYDEQRFSPLAAINDGNVADLGLAWYFDIETNRSMEATPLVIDGVIYVTAAWAVVYALDAVTGELLWQYDPQTPRAWGAYACCDVPNRGVAAWGDKIYVATFDGYLVALDRETGSVEWKADTIDRTPPYTITGAPRVVKGKVIIGNGGAEYGVRGYVTAYDAETGEKIWRTWTVPGNPADGFESDAMRMAAETWTGEWWTYGGGGTAWDSFAYDPELDLLYVGVGNGSPWNREVRSPGGGDNLFLASILALDPDDGAYRWHYQTTPGETWDYTATQHMILADLEIGGEPRKVLMQAPKNGFFYVIDRRDGTLISAAPYVALNWATHVDVRTGRPVEVPGARYEAAMQVIFPGAWGGHNWHPMSYSPRTGFVYIPVIGTSEPYATPAEFRFVDGHLNTAIDWKTVADVPAEEVATHPYVSARVSAWDPVRKAEAFRIEGGDGWNAGLLSTAGNLVFQGDALGEFAAYRADDGAKLWSAHAGTGIQAAPVTYAVGGEQYVTVVGGWGGSLGSFAGDPGPNPFLDAVGRVLTYKLGSDAELPDATITDHPFPDIADTTASAEILEHGRVLYFDRCSWCHGYDTIGNGSFPDLRFAGPETHETWNAIVIDGAYLGRGMPKFDTVMSAADAEAIQAYVIRQAHLTLDPD